MQTKELIAEIELLEEEVANREQHVLSMYRSIFEQCASRTQSEQSSSVTSPAHPKHEARKHPSIISSAFCSSKKFPFRPLQALVSIDDSVKRSSKSSHAQLPNNKANIDSAKIGSRSTEVLPINLYRYLVHTIRCLVFGIMYCEYHQSF